MPPVPSALPPHDALVANTTSTTADPTRRLRHHRRSGGAISASGRRMRESQGLGAADETTAVLAKVTKPRPGCKAARPHAGGAPVQDRGSSAVVLGAA